MGSEEITLNTTQPYKLLQFIKNINIDSNTGIVVDSRYSSLAYSNRSYLLSPTLSKSAQSIQKVVADNQTFTYDYSTDITGLIPFFESLNKNPEYQYLYRAFQVVILEAFSMVYSIENLGSGQLFFTNSDMDRVHNSISGLINNVYGISQEGSYDAIISLRELDSNLLYLYSTIGGANYTISASTDNKEGRINLIPNSSFSRVTDFYVSKDAPDVSAVTSVLGSSSPYELVYTGSSVNGIMINTKPISSYYGTKLTLRAKSNFPLYIKAVDSQGTLIKSFVNEKGEVIRDGILSESVTTAPGVQMVQSFYIPTDVDYISIYFTIKQADNTGDDRISELMLANGSFIGSYVEGAVE